MSNFLKQHLALVNSRLQPEAKSNRTLVKDSKSQLKSEQKKRNKSHSSENRPSSNKDISYLGILSKVCYI
jgi:hypothetical protein